MAENPYAQFREQAAAPAPAPQSDNPYAQFRTPKQPSKWVPDSTPGQPIPTPPGGGFLDKAAGLGHAGLSALSSATTGLLGRAGGALGGMAGSIATGRFGTQQGAQMAAQSAEEGAQRLTYAPTHETGRGYLESAGHMLEGSKLAGLGPTEAVALGGIPRPPVAGSIASRMRPNLDPQTIALAQKAEELGIRIPPDKLSDNKFLRIIGEASRQVPLSGAGTKENAQAFNRAIIRTFGGDESGGKISPQVYAQAMDKHGGAIGDISAAHPVPYTPQVRSQFQEMAQAAKQFETADVAKIVGNYVDEIEKFGAAGAIDGESMRKLRTKLTGQMRRTNNGDLKYALSELDDVMLDSIQAQLSPQELAAFNQARRFYANGKTVEPLIAKAAVKGSGDMSPAALAGQVTSSGARKGAVAKGKGGDLADIAAVGSRFLTEPGSSNTAERSLAYGALGGGGFMGGLPAALGIYGGANLYNRLGPGASRMMLPPPPP